MDKTSFWSIVAWSSCCTQNFKTPILLFEGCRGRGSASASAPVGVDTCQWSIMTNLMPVILILVRFFARVARSRGCRAPIFAQKWAIRWWNKYTGLRAHKFENCHFAFLARPPFPPFWGLWRFTKFDKSVFVFKLLYHMVHLMSQWWLKSWKAEITCWVSCSKFCLSLAAAWEPLAVAIASRPCGPWGSLNSIRAF